MLDNCPRTITFILIFTILLSLVLVLPTEARAETVSGTSPSLSPGETFEVVIDDVDEGTILWWGWFSDEDVVFWVEAPNGDNISSVSDYDGILTQQSGTYKLIWRNDNTQASLQVTYSYEYFVPESCISDPAPGTTISNLTPTIYGNCGPKVIKVRVSTDDVTFHDAVMNNLTWSWNATLSPGQNAVYVESTYWNGYFEYRHTQSYELNVDTLWLYEENGNSKIGLGIIGIALAMVLIVFLVILYIRKGKKSKK
ncbi:MAG: hypothetical protein GKC03_07565 [Methanomassiliicoccales archaeon]|nr:hypothetical protein [Methanomassiliicoccales archaeon]NYT15011.1 hypothetical protein [Methanomassiliicoccales archaeon]